MSMFASGRVGLDRCLVRGAFLGACAALASRVRAGRRRRPHRSSVVAGRYDAKAVTGMKEGPMRRGLILIGVLITLGASLLGGSAQAAGTTTVKLKSVVFAAQVGSTSGGGSVFAGAVIDRALGHGA